MSAPSPRLCPTCRGTGGRGGQAPYCPTCTGRGRVATRLAEERSLSLLEAPTPAQQDRLEVLREAREDKM